MNVLKVRWAVLSCLTFQNLNFDDFLGRSVTQRNFVRLQIFFAPNFVQFYSLIGRRLRLIFSKKRRAPKNGSEKKVRELFLKGRSQKSRKEGPITTL